MGHRQWSQCTVATPQGIGTPHPDHTPPPSHCSPGTSIRWCSPPSSHPGMDKTPSPPGAPEDRPRYSCNWLRNRLDHQLEHHSRLGHTPRLRVGRCSCCTKDTWCQCSLHDCIFLKGNVVVNSKKSYGLYLFQCNSKGL